MAVLLNVFGTVPARAVIAEKMLTAALGIDPETQKVDMVTAGIGPIKARGLSWMMRRELRHRGVSDTFEAPAVLTADMIDRAELVLTSTRQQRNSVAAIRPDALYRVFTLRELASLMTGVRPEIARASTAEQRLSALADLATERRGTWRPPPPRDLDIAAGQGLPHRDRRVVQDVEAAIAVIAPFLVLAPARRPRSARA